MSVPNADPNADRPLIADGAAGDVPLSDCWNAIGVMGDKSCPELIAAIHCRNCPVFAAAARTLLDRPESEGKVSEDDPSALDAGRQGIGVLIFRLGGEWLAFRAQVVVEVTVVHSVHRIPHRSDATLVGLTNLRGQLHLCISLHGLFGVVATTGTGTDANAAPRMITVRQGTESWVFVADDVRGVPRVPPDLMRNVPSTLANPAVSFSQSVFTWGGLSVGLLDEGRVFDALRSLVQ
jgi:chemotaxis-related protein WspD